MNKITIFDGATGTMIQKAGLKLGEHPEIFGINNPEKLEKIYKSYIEAGSNVINANTFGASRRKLAGTGVSVEEAVMENVHAAKKAAQPNNVKVTLDIGPLGDLMEPLGLLTFDEAYDMFKEIVIAGEKAGADLILFETFTDLLELKAGILAASENTNLPIWATMSFESNGRTFTGTTVDAMALTLNGLPVEAMGINCSLGPNDIYPLIVKMKQWTDKKIIVKPNAGLPDPATGKYAMTADVFASQMKKFVELGVDVIGGCCGTTPDFIKAISSKEFFDSCQSGEKESECRKNGVCSYSQVAEYGGVKVVGERINPTGKKRFQQALLEKDWDYIKEKAIEQVEAGADVLDVNVGIPNIDEPEMMKEAVKMIQSVTSLPLQIDSSNPEAIEAGLRICKGKAIVNSVNGEDEKLEKILPLVKKYGAAVVGLTMDNNGIPQTAQERFAIAEKILNAALQIGIPREDVIIDCLTLTISAQQEQAIETLKAVRMVREKLGLHCTLGVSNISFGLPERNHITGVFLAAAMNCGLDFPIINPNTKEIMDCVASYRALSCEDASCERYIERFASEGKTETPKAVENSKMTVEDAILKGLGGETKTLTEKLLETMSEMDIINEKLIPALDVVGVKYEKQEIFLPQLINAANAACEGFEVIKARIAKHGGESISKGKIIMATVEGDIHDIGKNIVKVVLENYGYTVIDLGKDVPVQKVVDAAIENDVHLIGLSALMTTTVESMKRTIEALKASGHDCKVFVGGAVLTAEYAEKIGADYYTKDAKESADVAKAFFEN